MRGEREHGNTEDRFAVAVIQHRPPRGDDDSDVRTTVGHLPRKLSQVLWYFILHGGEIDCEVTGRRQCSPPCCVTLSGKNKVVAKAEGRKPNCPRENDCILNKMIVQCTSTGCAFFKIYLFILQISLHNLVLKFKVLKFNVGKWIFRYVIFIFIFLVKAKLS